MNTLLSMIWVESNKALRSRMPLFTLFGALLIPLIAAFFMVILKDPEFARQAGLISTKAELMAESADWPTYLGILAQAIGIGGILMFSLIYSWVFGREFVDGTAKDMLAVPIARRDILLAKFIVVTLWSVLLILLVYALGFVLGHLIVLPQDEKNFITQGTITYFVTALLVINIITPMAFFASISRGYLLPIGVTLLFVILANVLVVAGWGAYFPWSIPGLYAGAGNPEQSNLSPISYGIVLSTCLLGILSTYLWWQVADQHT